MKNALTLAAIGSVLLAGMPVVFASSPAFDAGVKSYGAHHYSDAINQFGAAEKQSPSDPSIHYYMGLCYQAQNQMSLAKQEFSWVGQNGSGVLRSQANTALQNLSRYTSQVIAATTPAPTATKIDGFTAKKIPRPEKKFQGRLKVLEFTTSSCHYCRAFEPIWEETASHLSNKADFRQLDAEDPGNANLVSRYSVKGYPTFVYSDDTGNKLAMHQGTYQGAGEFEAEIKRFFPQ